MRRLAASMRREGQQAPAACFHVKLIVVYDRSLAQGGPRTRAGRKDTMTVELRLLPLRAVASFWVS